MKNTFIILMVLALCGCGSSLPKLQYPDGSTRIPIVPQKNAAESTPAVEPNSASTEVICNQNVSPPNSSVSTTSIVTIKCSDPVRKTASTKKLRKTKVDSTASGNTAEAASNNSSAAK